MENLRDATGKASAFKSKIILIDFSDHFSEHSDDHMPSRVFFTVATETACRSNAKRRVNVAPIPTCNSY